MKTQLLAAAVAATMMGAATADVSIAGSAKVNYTNTDTNAGATTNVFKHEVKVNITGKSGDTTVSMGVESIGTDVSSAALVLKTAKVATSVAGVDMTIGQWTGSDTLLSNGSNGAGKFVVSTTMGALGLKFEDSNGGNGKTTVSGSLAGMSVSHSVQAGNGDTSIAGSMGGVSVAARSRDTGSLTDTSVELSTEVQGITLTYALIDAETATTTDAFFSAGTLVAGTEWQGVGISSTISGNKVTFKGLDQNNTTTNKIIVNRALASGATFEATYSDTDGGSTSIDLELAVSF